MFASMVWYNLIVYHNAWASALLILYWGQCEGLIRGISKVADSRASFYMAFINRTRTQQFGNSAGKTLDYEQDNRFYI